MCGICGEIRFDGHAADVGAVARMTGAMVSRGPDADGVVAHGPLALGHRRLSIIDLSVRGAQPMVDSDLGLTLVFNGCIYNYQQLRDELQAVGYRFFSTADSEVVIKAFHHWGVRCVDQFKGMFAFAVADRDTGVVTLARDRLGIKPLYLASVPGRLRFASTVRALLAAGGVDTRTGPPRSAPLHDLPLRGAGAAHDLPRRAQASAGNRAGDPSPTDRTPTPSTGPGIPPRSVQGVLVGRRLEEPR